ncbi:MAG: hypothetical protein AAF649_01110 [Verrucomicrobiota bacterium]
MNDKTQNVWDQFVDLGGRSAQRLGMPRSLGQVYAALYLSPKPLGLQDLMDQLHISKGNASMSVRQLADWGAVKRIWVKGDRKDYYQVVENQSQVIRAFLDNMLKPRLISSGGQLEEMEQQLDALPHKDPNEMFYRKRITRLRQVHSRISKILPLLEGVLK